MLKLESWSDGHCMDVFHTGAETGSTTGFLFLSTDGLQTNSLPVAPYWIGLCTYATVPEHERQFLALCPTSLGVFPFVLLFEDMRSKAYSNGSRLSKPALI